MLDVVFGAAHFAHHHLRANPQLQAERGQLHAARGTQHEGHAQVLFELLQCLRQCRLREMQATRRRTDAALLGDCQKRAQLMVFHREIKGLYRQL